MIPPGTPNCTRCGRSIDEGEPALYRWARDGTSLRVQLLCRHHDLESRLTVQTELEDFDG